MAAASPVPSTSERRSVSGDGEGVRMSIHDAAKQVAEQCETSHAVEVDEGPRVGNDDHRDSSVATSFLRSSAE